MRWFFSITECQKDSLLHVQLASSSTKDICLMELFFFFLPVYLHAACVWSQRYSNRSGCSQKRDKPNICDDPNITLGSKNKCRSGSGDSPRALRCGPGSCRSAFTPSSLPASHCQGHLSQHTHWSAPLSSVLPYSRNYNDTLILTLAETFFYALLLVSAFL